MKTIAVPLKVKTKLKEIKQVLSDFPRWKDYSESSYCTLSDREVASINNYLVYNSNHITAFEFDITRTRANQILNKALRRLKRSNELYEQWREKTSSAGDHYNPPLMETPVYSLDISVPLRNKLLTIGVFKMKDLKEIDLKTLLNLKGFGEKSMQELRSFLKENNFSNLLNRPTS